MDYRNDAAPLLAEYNQRSRLAKIGYRFDPASLSTFKADCFTLIAIELQEKEAESLKSKKKGRAPDGNKR